MRPVIMKLFVQFLLEMSVKNPFNPDSFYHCRATRQQRERFKVGEIFVDHAIRCDYRPRRNNRSLR